MKKFALLSLFALFLTTFAAAQCGSNCLFYGGDFDPNNPNANGLANENRRHRRRQPLRRCHLSRISRLSQLDCYRPVHQQPERPESRYRLLGNPHWRFGRQRRHAGCFRHRCHDPTATGRSDFGFLEYRDEVDGLSLNLTAGTQYWMAVVPNDPNNANRSFNSNTFGLNAVGTQVNNQQFWNSSVLRRELHQCQQRRRLPDVLAAASWQHRS